MTYTVPTQVPGTYQSRPDSAPNKSVNCGPAAITHVARYYKNRDFGINDTRRLAVLQNYRGTFPKEREVMLEKRGVPANADRYSVEQVIAAIRQRRAPLTASFLMLLIPYPYRRHSFYGSHEMSILALTGGSAPDAAIMDSNYGWPDGRTGYLPKYTWIPYAIWTRAFRALGGWAVIPDKAKVLGTRMSYRKSCTVISSGVNIRSGPGRNYTRVATASKGFAFTSTQIEKMGGSYTAPNGTTRRDWLSFVRSGHVVWIARAFCREA